MYRAILLGIISTLFAMPAMGATYWADLSGTGTGAANGSDVNNQCAYITDADCSETSGDTVYLCNARTSQLASADMINGVTYDWTCPGGTPGSVSTSGSTIAAALGARQNVTWVDPNISQTGTTHCLNMTSAQNIVIHGGGITTNGGKENATWANDNDLGVIGPCGNNAINIGNSAATNIAISGMYIKQTASHAVLFAPGASTAQSGISIEHSLIEDCGDADGEYCIYVNASASDTGTMTNFKALNLVLSRSGGVAVRVTGADDESYVEQIINPEYGWITSFDAGYYGSHAFQATTGSVFQWHDANGMYAHDLAGVRPSLEGGVLAGFYSINSRVEDIRCIDIILYPDQGNGSFCVDADVGIDGFDAKRIYANGNPGLESRSGCVGGNMCTGVGLGVFDAANVTFETAVLIGQRTCIYLSDPAGFPPPIDNIVFRNISCASPINFGLAIQTNIADNELTVVNSTFSGAGDYNVFNSKSTPVVWSSTYSNYWDGALLGYTGGTGDIAANPQFIGGSSPTTAEGFKPFATSPLCGAGYPTAAKYDYANKRLGNPPNIGAYGTCTAGRTSYSTRSTYDTR